VVEPGAEARGIDHGPVEQGVEAGLGLGQVDGAGGGQPAGEQHLVVVDVLAKGRLAGDDDRDRAGVARPQDGAGPAVADDHRRFPQGRRQRPELEVGLPAGRPDRRGRGAGLHEAAHPDAVAGQPGVGPPDQPVEAVVVGADADQQQRPAVARHSRLPIRMPLG
jgi:hypothetical protein